MLLEPDGVTLGFWPGARGHGGPAALSGQPIRFPGFHPTAAEAWRGGFPPGLREDLCTEVELLFREKWVEGCWDIDRGAIMIHGEGQQFLKVVWLHLSKKSSSKDETLKNCCREDWALGT